MARPKKSKQEVLARRRLAKRKKYAALKEDHEAYEAEKEKERARYLKRKAEGKILGINDLTLRAQREKRKRWRKNTKKYLEEKAKNKIEDINVNLVDASEDDSGLRDESDPIALNPLSKEAKTNDQVQKKDDIIFKLRAQVRRLRYERCSQAQKFKNILSNAKKENKKLKRLLRSGMTQTETTKNENEKRDTKTTQNKKRKRGIKNKKEKEIVQIIRYFLESDENSRVSSGKKEYITRNKIKMQRRYLTDTLKNLYKKFTNEYNNISVSYAFFCKNRPFWINFPKENRDTCECIYHCNTELLIKALNKSKIIEIKTNRDLLVTMCCNIYNEQCLDRKCAACKNKMVEYLEFSNDIEVPYYEWRKTSVNYEKKGKSEQKVVWTKTENYAKPRQLIEKFEKSLEVFLPHCANMTVQYQTLKKLKENISINEAIVHVDFSENYNLKYHEEIQSFNFAGSRPQVSIHTVVIYTKDFTTLEPKVHSICTVSNDLRHTALAIWAHLGPILDYISEESPFIDTVHFYSDSPSSQYRNRNMFYIMSQLEKEFIALRHLTWNYLEAGHGKGAPDGLGAVVKRTADRIVNSGTDIGTFSKFVEVIKSSVPNVKIEIVDGSSISAKESIFPKSVPPFKGTMSVHQVVWKSGIQSEHKLEMRRRSCFRCMNQKCVHYHIGLYNLNNVVLPEEEMPSSKNNVSDISETAILPHVENVHVLSYSPELVPSFNRGMTTRVLDEKRLQLAANSDMDTRSHNSPSSFGKENRRVRPLKINSTMLQNEVEFYQPSTSFRDHGHKMIKQEGTPKSIILKRPLIKKSVIFSPKETTVTYLSKTRKDDWQNATFIDNYSKSYCQEFEEFISSNCDDNSIESEEGNSILKEEIENTKDSTM